MDDRLKPLMQRLGDAIDESLLESESIAEVIGDIKKAGYDIFLVIEATIVFRKRKNKKDIRDLPTPNKVTVDLKFTSQDKELLGEMHIASNDEGPSKDPPKQLPPPKKDKLS